MISAQNISNGTGFCPDPSPENGYIASKLNRTVYPVDSRVFVDCNAGFTSTQVFYRWIIKCEEPGIWRPSIPLCIPNDEGKYNLYFLLRQTCNEQMYSGFS